MGRDVDALVIGAGPAGASAAALLAANGWSVALVEKQRFPRRKVCGECVAASNLPLLDALGLGDALASLAGPPLRRVAVMSADRTVSAPLPAAPHPSHAWARTMRRERLDAVLRDCARDRGAIVLQPWTLQSVIACGGERTCRLEQVGGEGVATLQCALVIDAHGSWEPLPQERGGRRQGHPAGRLLAFKATFEDADLAPGLLPVLSFRGGYGGMVIADSGLMTLACCVRADRLHAWRRACPGAPAGEAVEAALGRECDGVRRALRGARRQGPWLAAGPLAPGVRLRENGSAGLAIGNAAGEAHPLIGEGISMALQSAWLLCELLMRYRAGLMRGGADAEAALEHVQRVHAARWRTHFAPRLRWAAVLAALAMHPAPMPLLAAWPGLLTRAARWSGKLRCAPDVVTIESLAAVGHAAYR